MMELREVMKMGHVHPILEEAFVEYGYMAKWEAQTEERNSRNIAKNLIRLGLPFETIVSATKLDPEKVRELYASANDTV